MMSADFCLCGSDAHLVAVRSYAEGEAAPTSSWLLASFTIQQVSVARCSVVNVLSGVLKCRYLHRSAKQCRLHVECDVLLSSVQLTSPSQ